MASPITRRSARRLISLVSYTGIERPARAWLRALLAPRQLNKDAAEASDLNVDRTRRTSRTAYGAGQLSRADRPLASAGR